MPCRHAQVPKRGWPRLVSSEGLTGDRASIHRRRPTGLCIIYWGRSIDSFRRTFVARSSFYLSPRQQVGRQECGISETSFTEAAGVPRERVFHHSHPNRGVVSAPQQLVGPTREWVLYMWMSKCIRRFPTSVVKHVEPRVT